MTVVSITDGIKRSNQSQGLYDKLETGNRMQEDNLPANLVKRLEELKGREASYWEDEMYSNEALTNLHYREQLETAFKLDPLGPMPPRL
ncbi:MAG: hypothetical protein HYX67_00045 [Candidatus Melainabacteria bacterium]|nr:hypothetical protein [Candidatus Melainabacteria bacterium]